MPAVGRIGDLFTDGDVVASGSGDVFVDNIPVTRLTDMTTGHSGPPPHGFYPPAPIVEGSGTVFINNLPVARVGDKHAVHTEPPHSNGPPHPHDGAIASGSSNVFADS